MLLPGELAAIARWCEETGVQLVSDEIYHGITYAGLDPASPGGSTVKGMTTSAWETSREAIVFGSFSKYFSMTGWRLGWMLAPTRLVRTVDVLTGNFSICPPVLAQRAALAAFAEESYAELDGHVRRYAHNRDLLLAGLQRLGITRLAPADGAFYAYADVRHLTDDSMTFARDLLARTGVAVAAGIDFDTAEGHRYLRFSFAGTAGEIEQALDRLSTVC
ncbi:MAG TPA: aminotransferase class I/II-fold pyridoxal phosphate-dependent enzyme, partial [Nocardioides sp.]|nr:aminotransferase class I/II-fold pyridoxal phosphate-dependent enzyme [Nocardioides sp.]